MFGINALQLTQRRVMGDKQGEGLNLREEKDSEAWTSRNIWPTGAEAAPQSFTSGIKVFRRRKTAPAGSAVWRPNLYIVSTAVGKYPRHGVDKILTKCSQECYTAPSCRKSLSPLLVLTVKRSKNRLHSYVTCHVWVYWQKLHAYSSAPHSTSSISAKTVYSCSYIQSSFKTSFISSAF